MKTRKLRNIPTHKLLLLLAQANYMGAQFVDLVFYFDTNTVGVTPIMKDEVMRRFNEGKDGTSMEDIINDEL